MAGQADGSVVVDTELDPTGFRAGSKDLQQAVRSLVSKVNALEPTARRAAKGSAEALQSFQGKAFGVEETITELRQRLDDFATTRFPLAEYKALVDDLEKAEVALDKLRQRQQQFRDLGVSENSREWRRLQLEIEKATADVEAMKRAKREMEVNGQAFRMGGETEAFRRIRADIDAASSSLQQMRQQVESGVSSSGRLASMGQRVGSAISGATSKAWKLVSTLGKASLSRAISGAKRLGTTLRSLVGVTKRLIMGNRDYEKSFKKLTKSAKKFAFGLLGVKSVWMILKKAVSSYMSANEELATTQKRIWASLGSFLGPAIERVIGFVAKAVSYFSAFLHLLGFTSKSASTAINKSSKKAQKETKKLERQLAAFDELNILSDNKSNDSDSSDDEEPPITPLPDAELPEWVKEMAALMKDGQWAEAARVLNKELTKLMDSIDWGGAGEKAGKALNGPMEFLKTVAYEFPWDKLGKHLAEFANGLMKTVNWSDAGALSVAGLYIALKTLTGFFEELDPQLFSNAIYDFIMGAVNAADWPTLTGEFAKALNDFILGVDFNLIGSALGAAIQTVIASIHAALDAFDWLAIGAKLADFLNGILYAVNWTELGTVLAGLFGAAILTAAGFALNLDWAKLAQSLSDFAIGFFNGITDALGQVDWEQLGRNVVIFLENVDWGGVIQSLVTLAGTIIGSFFSFLRGVLSEAWNNFVEYMTPYLFKNGEFTILGFLEGIANGIKDIGNWILEHIFQPFIDAFKKAFGIASPSTEMQPLGGFIVDGMLEGIKSALLNVKNWLKEHVYDPIVNGIKTLFGIHSPAKETKTLGEDVSEGLKSGMSGQIGTGDKIKGWLKTNITGPIMSGIKGLFGIKNNKASETEAQGKALTEGLHSGIKAPWNNVDKTLKDYAAKVVSAFKSKEGEMRTTGSNLMNQLKSGLSSGWSTIPTLLSGYASRITSAFSAKYSSMNTIGKNLMSGLEAGMTYQWNHSTSKTVSTIASYISSAMSDALGVASPSKVFAEIGGYLMDGLSVGMNDEKKNVLQTTSGIASAITAEMETGEFAINSTLPRALDQFGDLVTDKFTALIARLESIAGRVTFAAPAMANGAVPYSVAAAGMESSGQGKAQSDDLASVLIQVVNNAVVTLVRAIEENGGTVVNIDKSSLTQAVIEETNRITRMTGTSPLLI